MSTSRSLNKVMLIGNLTRDPILRETTNGSKVCTFGLATNTTWKDTSGSVQERTEFHNVVTWNKLAEICAQILATGMSVYVEGELRTRTWTDENGTKHHKTEIKAHDMKLQDSKGKQGANPDLVVSESDQVEEEVTVDNSYELVEETPVTQESAKTDSDKSGFTVTDNDKNSSGDDLF